MVNLVLAMRNAWSRVKRLAGKGRFSNQSVAPAAQGGRRHRQDDWVLIQLCVRGIIVKSEGRVAQTSAINPPSPKRFHQRPSAMVDRSAGQADRGYNTAENRLFLAVAGVADPGNSWNSYLGNTP